MCVYKIFALVVAFATVCTCANKFYGIEASVGVRYVLPTTKRLKEITIKKQYINASDVKSDANTRSRIYSPSRFGQFCMHVNERRLTTLVQTTFRISQEVHFYFYCIHIQHKDVCVRVCELFLPTANTRHDALCMSVC